MKGTKSAAQELDFRVPMAVTQIRLRDLDGAFPVCPQCKVSLEREHQRFCDRCGQRLNWKGYKRAEIIHCPS